MNTRFLASLCAVAEGGSIAAAARRLDLTPAAIGGQIRTLERELGARLLFRAGSTVRPTPAGEAVIAAAHEVLARVEALRQVAHLREPRGLLRVGAIATGLISLLPDALRRMAQHYPQIDLRVVPGTSMELYAMIAREEIDCAMLVEPPFPLPKSLSWQPVRREPLVLLVPRGLAITSIAQALASQPLIRLDRRAWSGRHVTAYLQDLRLSVSESLELDAPETIAILVARRLGVALVPDWGLSKSLSRSVRKLRITDPAYARTVGVLGVAGGIRARLIQAFVESLSHTSEAPGGASGRPRATS